MIKLFYLFLFTAIQLLYGMDYIIYPKAESSDDKRYNDCLDILKNALEITKKEFGDYSLTSSSIVSSRKRWLFAVEEGREMNLIYNPYREKFAEKLLPIFIPLRKGILGYRIFLINKNDQKQFSKVKNLNDLKKFTAGQGYDWGDIKIYNHNNIQLALGKKYENLFKMLINHRFDYFPRGINEIFEEYNSRKSLYPNLHIENDLLVYYPWPYIFYVSPRFPRLQKRITKGLELIISNGSFEKIFYKYHHKDIIKAKLNNRKLIKLINPYLSSKFNMNDEKLWFKINK